jgi:hypothetical protein
MPDATYYKTTGPTGTEILHCLYCERGGQEHSATDPALFASHMEQRHDGRLIEGHQPEAPAPAPAEEDVPEPAPSPPPTPPAPAPAPAEPPPEEGT